MKPLWLRLWQRYYSWRAGILWRLRICTACGWRPSHGEYCCPGCFDYE